mgnify:FL=1|tara:strand:- start:403 stop:672 length:270 start_codon:yes stop_codon:yes gene_type:complete
MTVRIEEVTLLIAHDESFAIDTLIDRIKLGNDKNHYENSKPIMDGFIFLDYTCNDIATIKNNQHEIIMKKNYKHGDIDKLLNFKLKEGR